MNNETNLSTLNEYPLTEQEVFQQLTLSQIVTKNYRAAGVFEKYSLDFCCKGNRPLNEVCNEKGLNTEKILSELENTIQSSHDNPLWFNSWDLDFLVDYIINVHHRYIHESIPVISAHANKVASVHGNKFPETVEINKIFTAVYKELKQHMLKEEEILFPYIKYIFKVNKNESKAERSYFGTIANPIKMMEAEHAKAGDSFFQIRKLSRNYTPPAEACLTYSTYYKELKEFEEDLHKHVHLENNILFIKAIELEKQIFID